MTPIILHRRGQKGHILGAHEQMDMYSDPSFIHVLCLRSPLFSPLFPTCGEQRADGPAGAPLCLLSLSPARLSSQQIGKLAAAAMDDHFQPLLP